MRPFLLRSAVLLGATIGISAQSYTSSPYTDPNTGIDFQRYVENSQSAGYSWGIALPETPTTDFIGQLVVPLNSSQGWGGVSLGMPKPADIVPDADFCRWSNDQFVAHRRMGKRTRCGGFL